MTLSYLENLIIEVDKTHPAMGELVAICLIGAKARKLVLIVSPSGCGKSTAMSLIAEGFPNAIKPDQLSVYSLAKRQEQFTSFRSVIVVDDIATTQTDYARKATLTALAALCYTHRIESIMHDFVIEDFYGSALVGIQPILLRGIMLLEEWDASIQDKTLRYYYLHRPLKPVLVPPDVRIEKGIDIDTIHDFEPDIKDKNWQVLTALGDSQWSRARSKEHLKDLLKAVASLEKRQEVIANDYALLARLLKPMAIENITVVKEQLEGERYLDNNLLALLTEYYSYSGEFSLGQVALDYKLSMSQCYRIMQGQDGNWQQISKSPTIYKPTKKLIQILKNYELECKGDKNADKHTK